jgi:hypothetical protein
MLLLEEKNKMLHLIRLKAYLQAFMFGKENIHGGVTILCSYSLTSFTSPCVDVALLLS